MEYKSFAGETKEIQERTVTGLAAITGNVDSGFDRIITGAFKKTLKEGVRRIRHLWMHDPFEPPIAAIKELREVGRDELPADTKRRYPEATGGLLVVREYLDTPRGNEVLAGIKAGALNEMSFGYDAIKADFEEIDYEQAKVKVRNLKELRVWDLSDVLWGMNNATVASKALFAFKDTGIEPDLKAAFPVPTLADFTDLAWEALPESEKRRIAQHYAGAEGDGAPESFEDLRYPHHLGGKSGIGPAIWTGVSVALARLTGYGSAADALAGDRKAVYAHLAEHYAQFGQEAPSFKLVELATLSRALLMPGALKEGRLLTSRDLDRLTGAMHVIQNLIVAAEPLVDPKSLALTVKQRLALAEREAYLFQQ